MRSSKRLNFVRYQIFGKLLSLIVSATLAVPSLSLAAVNSEKSVTVTEQVSVFNDHKEQVNDANAAYYGWYSEQARKLKSYLPQRGLPHGPNEDFDIHLS